MLLLTSCTKPQLSLLDDADLHSAGRRHQVHRSWAALDPVVALQDSIYGNDIRQLLSLTEVVPGNISAGLVGEVVAIVNPGAAYTIGFSTGGSAQGKATISAGRATI